jgi:hypothetical protein
MFGEDLSLRTKGNGDSEQKGRQGVSERERRSRRREKYTRQHHRREMPRRE